MQTAMAENSNTGTALLVDDDALELSTVDTATFGELGYPMRLLHPGTGKPTKAVITVRGHDSPTYQAKKHEMMRANIERARNKDAVERTPEEVDQDGIGILVNSTIGWTGLKLDGVDYPYSEANARALYKKYRWIYEQVDKAVHNRANFLKGSATV